MHVIKRVVLRKKDQALPSSSPQPLKAAKASADDIRALADSVVNNLEDDKAEDIISIDLQGKSSLADMMIIASGRSARHVASIADHLSQTMKEVTGRPVKVEGLPNADWVLLDIGDIIVHLFRPEVRTFYNLEKIWADDSAHGHA